MTPWQELRRISRKSRVFLCVLFVLYNVFAVVRALPINSTLRENRESDRGTYNRNVYRIFKLAKRQAAQPFFEVKNHVIFFDRNPGMFMFVAELFVRAGATTPFPNQLLAIALWDAGLLLLYLWLLALFRSELAAAAALAHLAFTPFLLFYSSSIHHEPWCFVFFNLMFYCYVCYLRNGERRSLIATCIAYFFLCQSYWFYYMSAGLLLIALQWRERKLSLRDTLILGLVPVVATLTTFAQVAYALGGIDAALFRMKDIAAARTVDMRIENSQWYPEKKFLNAYHWQHYPQTVRERLELISGTSVFAFVSMLFASCALAGRAAWRRLGFMLWVLLAGASWNLVMIQHTVIHRFAGMYGWFTWSLIVAVFVGELQFSVKPRRLSRFVIALALPLTYLTLSREYVPFLQRYVTAARTGEAQPSDAPKPSNAKKKRKPQPEAAPPAADSLNEDDMRE
jgi:hypothetical protein